MLPWKNKLLGLAVVWVREEGQVPQEYDVLSHQSADMQVSLKMHFGKKSVSSISLVVLM